jgi:signal transduction histidine kinase
VFGDPTACARIVRVLLDNALRYSQPGSPVTVVLDRDRLTVADAGPGIPADDRERVFERFARGAGANPAGGFGLGLAIARELSERMGGSLALAEHGPGASFVLRLPRAPAIPNAIPTEASPA